MTNGEMIQKVFKGCEVCEPIIEDDIIHVAFADKKDSAIGFDWSWWNAEYKEPTTKNDLGVDCISRDDVRDVMRELWGTSGELMDRLMALPSVTPQEPKTGHWIEQNDDYYDWYECSECGYGSEGEMQYSSKYDVRTNYCPCCGAKMEEVEE